MIYIKKYEHLAISVNASIRECLKKMDHFSLRTLVCIGANGSLEGTFSFGDFNRWVLVADRPELNAIVSEAMNTRPYSVEFGSLFNGGEMPSTSFSLIPVTDTRLHVVGVLTGEKSPREVHLGAHTISEDGPPFLIAEIGNNHNGSLENAKRLVDLAAQSGAHSAKFQLRDMASLFGENVNEDSENLGSQYTMDLLRRFQLSTAELLEVMQYTRQKGLLPLCTPWDEKSADILDEFGVDGFKVASADFTNHGFLRYLARTGKPLICSTGMASEEEIRESIKVLRSVGAQFVLLHCNSTYPAPFKDINLSYLPKLRKSGDCIVGYSGHERGINVAVAAVGLGAKIIEKHFTTDRSLEGNDHKVSLLPDEFREMANAIEQVYSSLGSNGPRQLTQGEMMNRVTLAKSIYAARDIESGALLDEADVIIKSPGRGLQPNYLKELLSKPLRRNVTKGDVFYPDDIVDEVVEAKSKYGFWSKWGIPVRHHDYRALLDFVSPDMLEFHLSYKDLDLEHDEYFPAKVDAHLVVHAPELFYGDHTLDLSSEDEAYRKHSIVELKRTIEVVKAIKPYFKNHDQKIGLVTNVGGFSHDRPLTAAVVDRRAQILRRSLVELENDDVEIWPQTMPPFPWHFGGQQYHNLFLDGDWISNFCEEMNMRVCLDVSHSALACNKFGASLSQFLDTVLPYTAHLHLADAAGVDDEGLQIGDGGIDWVMIAEKMKLHAPAATWLPEIWQGHENNGAGFWVALDRLERKGF